MGWLDYDDKKADEAGGGNFEPIPIGAELPVRIAGFEQRDTRNNGKMVTLEFSVIDGPHKKRRIWRNFLVVNSNESTQHRARRELADIGKIVNVDVMSGPDMLGKLKGRDLLCVVTEHEEYNGKTKEIVSKFSTDPNARNPAQDYDDSDIPF